MLLLPSLHLSSTSFPQSCFLTERTHVYSPWTRCFSQTFHRPLSLDATVMSAWRRGFVFCWKNFRHTQSFTSIHFNFSGRSIIPYLPHFHVWGQLGARRENKLFFTIAWWGLQWAAFWHRTVSMKAETTKSILRHHNRWKPQNFNVGFPQITFGVDSFLKALREREPRKEVRVGKILQQTVETHTHSRMHVHTHTQSPTLSHTLIISSFRGL